MATDAVNPSVSLRQKKARTARGITHGHPVNVIHHDQATLGERLADQIAAGIGSWTFLIVQTVIVIIWMAGNAYLYFNFDPRPFILLNLLFSIQAAYTGPVLLLAGNRQAQKDRLTLEHAADEAEMTEQRTLTILKEIQNNTEITVKILSHLQEQQSTIVETHQRMAAVHEQMAREQHPGA